MTPKFKLDNRRCAYHVEDPYLTLPIPMLETYRAISDEGIKVTIDGHGADELFSGYGHLKSALHLSNVSQTAELVSIINSLKTGNYSNKFDNAKINFVIQKLGLIWYLFL